ncbi:MAG: hypothetical protein JWN46_2009 [Acidimicrobiales bacterium]|nr:hypothetical protein [Acidimicrobiales bacterium]
MRAGSVGADRAEVLAVSVVQAGLVGDDQGEVLIGRVVQAGSVGDDQAEVLVGGVANAGAVVRVGRHVLRPSNRHSDTIHELLRHVRAAGCLGVPEVVGVEPDGRERLVFVPGDVPVPPYPAWSLADAVLASTARVLRRFHDATVGFVATSAAGWSDEMRDPLGGDVICHNDVCPENVVYRSGTAIALLDFDFAAPGRRVWDLAALARMCVPVDADEDAARTGRGGLDVGGRLRVVADGYVLGPAERLELLDVLGHQIEHGGEFVRRRVAAGEAAFIEMDRMMGGPARFDRRRRWFADHHARFAHHLA